MSTHLPSFQSFSGYLLHHFVLAKLATSSIRVGMLSNYLQIITALVKGNDRAGNIHDYIAMRNHVTL